MSNKCRFYWCIHIATESHGDLLKIITSLNSDMYDSTNPVIDASSMCIPNFLHLCSNDRCSHEECLLKSSICWEWRFLIFDLFFCFCSPIFLNDLFYDVICLVNTDSIFIFNNVNVEEF